MREFNLFVRKDVVVRMLGEVVIDGDEMFGSESQKLTVREREKIELFIVIIIIFVATVLICVS